MRVEGWVHGLGIALEGPPIVAGLLFGEAAWISPWSIIVAANHWTSSVSSAPACNGFQVIA